MPLVQSFETVLLFQTTTKKAVKTVMQARRDIFSISADISSTPDARPFFNFGTTIVNSLVLWRGGGQHFCQLVRKVRSTVGQERLNGLAFKGIEHGELGAINWEEAINNIAEAKVRKVRLKYE